MNYRAAILLACLGGAACAQTREHAETAIVIHLPAPPAAVFPLFGPVRESEWSPHWNPQMIFPTDKRQLPGSVFTTGHDSDEAVWLMDTYDEAALRIGYVILRPGKTATRLDIALKSKPDHTTEATITYRLTALSEAGDQAVKEFARSFPSQRDHWEQAVTHRLRELAHQQ